MRGKDVPIVYDNGAIGITPAYAGKSLPRFHRPRWIWDHPRLCGEKRHTAAFNFCIMGSPPPMRGKASTLATPFP